MSAQFALREGARLSHSRLHVNDDGRRRPGRPSSPSIVVSAIPGIREVWSETLGDPSICVAILDGPVDTSHPSIRGAALTRLETLVPGTADNGPAARHATHIASLIFGQPGSPVMGLAPRCRGLIVPIFASIDAEAFRPCSQLDFARAISQALENGANIINVSGGQFSPAGAAHPLLANVVRACARRGVLIVAAAGNDGCECLHVPAALDSVLAVGAMDSQGEPLAFSNWGSKYRLQGVLAPGEGILGAGMDGHVVPQTGTSYATALVSGIAALLMSYQRKRGQKPDAALIRKALVQGALGCSAQPTTDCRRLLAGRLHVPAALSLIRGASTMSADNNAVQASDSPGTNSGEALEGVSPSFQATEPPRVAVSPERSPQPETGKTTCGCQTGRAAPQFVYALGQIGYDLVSEARLDSLAQHLGGVRDDPLPARVFAFNALEMLAYLDKHPEHAAAIEWTLSVDGTPIYAIRPFGPFAAETYQRLREFLQHRMTERVDRVSIPGIVAGKATLFMGQTVPVVVPELRGMYSWSTSALVEKVVGPAPGDGATKGEREHHEMRQLGVHNFLHRVYYEARNLGTLPQDRALNFAATNAFAIDRIYESALLEDMELDEINVVPSPFCRPGSECWDVELFFFFPKRETQTVRKVYRFTVDVNDTVPVTVGPTRTWFRK